MKQGWEIKKLSEICHTSNGLWKGKKPPFITIGVLRSTNFTKDCKLKLDDVAYIEVEEKSFAKRQLQRNDIVVERSGGGPNQPVGRVLLFDIDDGNFSFCNFTSALRVIDSAYISPIYLHKYLSYFYLSGRTVKMQSNTIGLRNLDYTKYLDVDIPIPSLAEQKRIVEILDREFERIDALKANAEQNLQHAKDLFQSALKQELQPKEGWEYHKLIDIYNFIDYRGATPNKTTSGIPLITAKNIKKGYLDYSIKDFISEKEYKNRQKRGISKYGDILFTTEAPLGNVAIADKVVYSAGQRVITFQKKEALTDIINNSFYLYYFIAPIFQEMIKSQASGLTAQGIKASRLKDINIPLPKIGEQDCIASRLNKLSEQCKTLEENYKKTIALCDDMKQALLRKAFNGEL